jgi:hypothetical protein
MVQLRSEVHDMQIGDRDSEGNSMLRDFDRTAQLVKGFVAERYGGESADGLYRDARREYEAIIQTLADRCDHCDFRFKKDAGTQITSKTPEVQETIDRIHRGRT